MRGLSRWLRKYFIPHRGNEYKPHFLRHESMLLFFFVVIIIEMAFLVQVFIVFDKTKFLASVLPAVLTLLTNESRAQNDAPPLVQNELLAKAAGLKANDMATKGYFAHTSPDGKTPWYWFSQVGYSYSLAGENLAVNFFESTDVARAWMNSPSHRANIVKKDFTEIGVGVASGIYQGRNTVFVAQLFGTPIIKVPAKANTELATSAPSTKPKAPAVTPSVIAIAPVATQVLGEEINSPVVTTNTTPTSPNVKSFSKSLMQEILTSPRQYVTYVYEGIALLIILALLLVIFIKSEIRHPAIIARGLTLVAVIIFLLFLNIKLLHFETNIETEDITANTIAY